MARKFTRSFIKEIRRRSAAGEKQPAIAKALGISPWSVWKYASELNTKNQIARESKRYDRIKQDPELVAKRYEQSKEANRNRAASKRARKKGASHGTHA